MIHPPHTTVRPQTIGRPRILQANGVELDLDGYQVRVDGQQIETDHDHPTLVGAIRGRG
ncbi:Uncharacterised protein [Actinomadura madurae]|nr:Uncharacterised protein [Actinomadura madurae]